MLQTLYNSLLGSDGVDVGENENANESSISKFENATSGSSGNNSFSSFYSPDKVSNDIQNTTDPPPRVETADLDNPDTCKQILIFLLQESSTHKKEIEVLKRENQDLRESNDNLCCKTLKIIKFAKSMKKSIETNNEKIAVLDKQNQSR